MDILNEAKLILFFENAKRECLEPEHIQHMAKLYQMPPEEYYRKMLEGPTQEEQDIYNHNDQELKRLGIKIASATDFIIGSNEPKNNH